MDAVLLTLLWLLPALFVHCMYAVSLTASQRLGLLAATHDSDPLASLAKLDLFLRVSFDSHLWRVTTFRNPWKIYPDELRDAIWKVS